MLTDCFLMFSPPKICLRVRQPVFLTSTRRQVKLLQPTKTEPVRDVDIKRKEKKKERHDLRKHKRSHESYLESLNRKWSPRPSPPTPPPPPDWGICTDLMWIIVSSGLNVLLRIILGGGLFFFYLNIIVSIFSSEAFVCPLVCIVIKINESSLLVSLGSFGVPRSK